MASAIELEQLYKDILTSTGCTFDDSGLASNNIGERVVPCLVKVNSGKNSQEYRLALPTKKILDDPDWDNICIFHPLSENIVRGESPVLKYLKTLMIVRVSNVLSNIMFRLMEMGVDTDYHKKIKKKDFLKLIPNVNPKSLEHLNKIICASSIVESERRLISIYLHRGGNIEGNKYTRKATVKFPIQKELESDSKEVFGIKLTIADKKAIKDLLQFVIPDIGVEDTYSFGSNNDSAPYFESLCGAYVNVITQLNHVLDTLKPNFENYDELYSNVDWFSKFEDIDKLAKTIPPMPLNDGDEKSDKGALAKEVTRPQFNNNLADQFASTETRLQHSHPIVEHERPAPVRHNPNQQHHTTQPIQYQQPIQHHDNVVIDEDGRKKVSWSSVMSANPHLQQPMFQAPQNVTPPGEFPGVSRGAPVMQNGFTNYGNGMYQPSMMYQQPMYQQPIYQQPMNNGYSF